MEFDSRELGGYEKILKEFKNCLTNLTSVFITEEATPKQQNHQRSKALFAAQLIEALAPSIFIFRFFDRLSAENFTDTLITYSNKYINNLLQENVTEKIVTTFKTNITTLTSNLKQQKKVELLNNQEFNILKELINDLAHKCQHLFAEPGHNTEIEGIYAIAIALSVRGLSLNQQRLLADKLLLIKELWQLNNLKEINNSTANPVSLITDLSELEFTSNDQALSKIIEITVEERQSLSYLDDNKLTCIYDRLKNIEPQTTSIVELLEKVHIEAQYRYNSNRITDTEVELLKRFQSYDIILNQIENSEFTLVETFLIRKSMFMHEMIILIAKHADNISAIGIVQNPFLTDILKIISDSLPSRPDDVNSASGSVMLSIIKSKFSTSLNSHQAKRYAQLDKFTINSLRQKYTILLKHMADLLLGKPESKTFMEQTIVNKLAKNYYIANISSSPTKIKSMTRDRIELAKQLAEIDFVEICNEKYSNKITSLNIKSKFNSDYSLTAQQYVQSIVKVLVSLCTASQLRALQVNLSSKALTNTQAIVKEEIIKQVDYRTTKFKKLYYLLTGKGAELRELLAIKDSFLTLNPP